MSKEELREVIEENELIRMCHSYFDEESVQIGIDKLIDDISQLIDKKPKRA